MLYTLCLLFAALTSMVTADALPLDQLFTVDSGCDEALMQQWANEALSMATAGYNVIKDLQEDADEEYAPYAAMVQGLLRNSANGPNGRAIAGEQHVLSYPRILD